MAAGKDMQLLHSEGMEFSDLIARLEGKQQEPGDSVRM